MTKKVTTEKMQPYEYPETLTVPCLTEQKEQVTKLANIIKKNRKRIEGEFSNRITPASLCRVGLDVLLALSKELEEITFRDEADLTKQIKKMLGI